MDAIFLDNIDVLSKWRAESEQPLMEEALGWLEKGRAEHREEQEEEDEEEEQEKREEDVAVSTPPFRETNEPSSTPTNHH